MGLDMYLNGNMFYTSLDNKRMTLDDFEVTETVLQLGYWRKHPNLHGYIVTAFADGVDECQEIEISEEQLTSLIEAVEADSLPNTEGFFFGTSVPEDKQPTLDILNKALTWLQTRKDDVWKSVIYEASW